MQYRWLFSLLSHNCGQCRNLLYVHWTLAIETRMFRLRPTSSCCSQQIRPICSEEVAILKTFIFNFITGSSDSVVVGLMPSHKLASHGLECRVQELYRKHLFMAPGLRCDGKLTFTCNNMQPMELKMVIEIPGSFFKRVHCVFMAKTIHRDQKRYPPSGATSHTLTHSIFWGGEKYLV